MHENSWCFIMFLCLSWGLTITQNSIWTISDLDRSHLTDTRSGRKCQYRSRYRYWVSDRVWVCFKSTLNRLKSVSLSFLSLKKSVLAVCWKSRNFPEVVCNSRPLAWGLCPRSNAAWQNWICLYLPLHSMKRVINNVWLVETIVLHCKR